MGRGGAVIMVTKGGGGVGHISGQKQLSYYSIIFQGKVTFMVTFKEKMVSFLHH